METEKQTKWRVRGRTLFEIKALLQEVTLLIVCV